MNSNFFNVPEELQQLNQWTCWNYQDTESGKPTKIPINPVTKKWAKKNDPTTWCSFVDAVAHSITYDGIGFMVNHDDPYIFVDFDETHDPAMMANQRFYFEQLNSYSERSPSGKGLHILVRGKLESGRNKSSSIGIEVYPYSFMTVTGDVYHNAPIREAQELIEQLWESLEGTDSNADFANHSVASEATDFDIYNQAIAAKNGTKFKALYDGDIHTYHGGDHSRADFALIDILAFYTQDRGQIVRMFRASGLGKRPKAQRNKYLQDSITKAFDNLVPQIDISGLMSNLELQPLEPIDQVRSLQSEAVKIQDKIIEVETQIQFEKQKVEYDSDIAYGIPPGLTGEIADFIYKQAWKPVRQISMIGALGFMAGLAGRSYNASGYGLNLYLLLLAKTGRGKEAISKGYEKIFDCITPLMPTIRGFKGPGDLASGQALLRYMSDHQTKSFVSVFGEFGPMLKRITSPTAIGADLMTQKVMLDMYSKSGRSGRIDPTAYSDAEKNTQSIQSPAFTFVAESAPKWFDILANEGMIETGLLPRFIIAEYDGIRVPSNELGPSVHPSQSLTENIMALATQSLENMKTHEPYQIPISAEAMELSRQLDQEGDSIVNESPDEIICELWNRVHLNTIKVAGIIATGINPFSPEIDSISWGWAERFVKFNLQKLESKFLDEGVIRNFGDSESDEIKKVENSIVEFLTKPVDQLQSYGVPETLHRCKIIPWAYFSRRLPRLKPFKDSKIGAVNSIKRAVANLIDNGDLQEVSKVQAIKDFDFHGRCFAVRSVKLAKEASRMKPIPIPQF